VRTDFEHKLDDLLARVVELGERTDAMLGEACEALRDGDGPKADRVVAADRAVDLLDEEVQQGVLLTIALHGPVASDLRLLTAMLRASLHLERMGDYAVNVARAAKRSVTFPADDELAAQLTEMGDRAREVGRTAVTAFVHKDADLAATVPQLDDGVDRLNIGIFHRLVRLAAADEHRLEWATRMILVARLLERYGDHGVDLAEQAIFVATGEMVELSSNDPDDVTG
jgi:phosphate transport system protein